jgi:CheY-like chemotaxis protein
MKILLEIYGYDVLEAGDGLQAVETMKVNFPDLVLMDISMPVMDGLTATKAIRAFNRGINVPIIALTAHGNRLYDKAIAAGCNDLIEKPVDFDSFEIVLRHYLGN